MEHGTDSRKNRAVAGERTHRVLARVVGIRRCRRVAECLRVQFRVQAAAHPVLVDSVAKVADKPGAVHHDDSDRDVGDRQDADSRSCAVGDRQVFDVGTVAAHEDQQTD